ncbi:MAG: PstS family phosphate ABC transporter substrate-binding protein [Chloroflexi bacterium]|nr:PstS family phosphate ABC transporter substrate-binding protein [Chloroflexota bacterium]MQC28039.1 PstS family phosphate ABC transporter substrate-binding protein [Chloroflexota bacterium]
MVLFQRRRLLPLLLLLTATAFLAAACGDDDDDATATATSDGTATISGTISIEGSSTVQPFTIEVLEGFEDAFPEVTVNPPSGLGSGAGITAFINEEVDIAQASRTITQDEIGQATAAGLDAFETEILRDALAIIVHPSNTVEQLTFEQVAQIFAGEISDWSELGGTGGSIAIFTRNEESGTFAYMEEDVIQQALGPDAEYSADINKQANAPAGISGVATEPRGIFYAGLGNISDLSDPSVVKVVLIAKDEASPAVAPSAEAVADGSYPISRGLYYYTDGDPAQSADAALAAFMAYVLGPQAQAVGEELGFLPVGPTE